MTYQEIATELASIIPTNLFAQYRQGGVDRISIVQGPLEEETKVVNTGIECVITKVASRQRSKNKYYMGQGRLKTLKFKMLVMLWQPWNPELDGQGLAPKATSLESDTGDGESIMDKIYGMDSSKWFVYQNEEPRDDTNDHPETCSVCIEPRPQYCD